MAMVINLTLFNYLTLFHRIDGNSFSLNIFTQGNLDDNGIPKKYTVTWTSTTHSQIFKARKPYSCRNTFSFYPFTKHWPSVMKYKKESIDWKSNFTAIGKACKEKKYDNLILSYSID